MATFLLLAPVDESRFRHWSEMDVYVNLDASIIARET